MGSNQSAAFWSPEQFLVAVAAVMTLVVFCATSGMTSEAVSSRSVRTRSVGSEAMSTQAMGTAAFGVLGRFQITNFDVFLCLWHG
jgi:hypothetical protein